MSTVLDEKDETTVGEIARLAGGGDHVAAFREVLRSLRSSDPAARFEAFWAFYRHAGRSERVAAVLRGTYQQPGKAYAVWEVMEQVEGGVPERLRKLFKGRDVIVSGETHGDPSIAVLEGTLLPALGIHLAHEGATITTTQGPVTPDPPAYRLLYWIEVFYEAVLNRRNRHDSPQQRDAQFSEMDYSYARYLREFANHSQGAITASLAFPDVDMPPYQYLEKMKHVLYATLNLIERRPADPTVYSEPLIGTNARNFLELFDELKQASGAPKGDVVMRRLRSDRMLQAVQQPQLLGGTGRTVYKVGDNHVTDIRAQAGDLPWVLDEAEYKGIFGL